MSLHVFSLKDPLSATLLIEQVLIPNKIQEFLLLAIIKPWWWIKIQTGAQGKNYHQSVSFRKFQCLTQELKSKYMELSQNVTNRNSKTFKVFLSTAKTFIKTWRILKNYVCLSMAIWSNRQKLMKVWELFLLTGSLMFMPNSDSSLKRFSWPSTS